VTWSAPQTSPVYPQKSPVYLQKNPIGVTQMTWSAPRKRPVYPQKSPIGVARMSRDLHLLSTTRVFLCLWCHNVVAAVVYTIIQHICIYIFMLSLSAMTRLHSEENRYIHIIVQQSWHAYVRNFLSDVSTSSYNNYDMLTLGRIYMYIYIHINICLHIYIYVHTTIMTYLH